MGLAWRSFVGLVTALICFLPVAWADKVVVLQKETDNLVIDIRYPQEISAKIDADINQFIENQRAQIEKIAAEDKASADLPGKNGLSIRYQIMLQNAHTVSLLFKVSTNSRGAAHPNNTIATFNYIDNEQYSINTILQKNALEKIANLARGNLLKKEGADKQWIDKGTKPIAENYKNWYFSAKGLVIVFDTYQVAAYVYGPQKVLLSGSILKNIIKPEISRVVWGHE